MAFIGRSEATEFFDQDFYLSTNPDAREAINQGTFESGLDYFLNVGLNEGTPPSQNLVFFNEGSYLNQNSDVQEAVNNGFFDSGLDHFLAFGLNQDEVQVRIEEGGTGFEFYDEDYYVSNNSDIQDDIEDGSLKSGLEQFIQSGLDEGRPPSEVLTFFTADAYLENNQDVQNAVDGGVFDSALEHFLRFGVKEGLEVREGTGFNEVFDSDSYLEENQDVANAVEAGIFSSALEHFVEFGFEEGRPGGITTPFEVEANDAGGVDVTVIDEAGVEVNADSVSNAFPDVEGSDLSGADNIVGNTGPDTVFSQGGNDNVAGGEGLDLLTVGAGDDTAEGGAGNDTLVGGAGNDSLQGGAGNDSINGSQGDDTLNGGAGADELTGDDGADTFVLSDAADSAPDAADTINGFVAGEDTIDLTAISEDLTFGDNVTLQDGTLNGPGFAIALDGLEGELSADDLNGVEGSTNTVSVNADDAGNTLDATSGDVAFEFAQDNYEVTVDGFDSGDQLDFFGDTVASVSLIGTTQTSGDDGEFSIEAAVSGSIVRVNFTGVDPEDDAQITGIGSFDDVFGEDSVIA